MKRMLLGIPRLVMGCMLVSLCMGSWHFLHAEETQSGSQQESSVDLQIGWVDAVSDHEVVINDMAAPFDSITLYDQRGFLLDTRSLVAGQNVAYARRAGGMEIHLLDEKLRRRDSPQRVSQHDKTKTKKEVIRQVDGVWKN